MAELVWHVEAERDLASIAEFISRHSLRLCLSICRSHRSCGYASSRPSSAGRVIPEIGIDSYRELIFQNYRLAYRVLPDPL